MTLKSRKYRDDELIAYLIGEGSPDDRERLSRAVDSNPRLADRLASLETLHTQLRLLPIETFYRKKQQFSPLSLLARVVVLVAVFYTGVFIQSKYSLLREDAQPPVSIEASTNGDFPPPSTIIM